MVMTFFNQQQNMIQKLNSLLSSEYENIMLQGLHLLEVLDDDQLIDYFWLTEKEVP